MISCLGTMKKLILKFKKYPFIVPTFIFLLFLLIGANLHPLWGDEAETALFARNINVYGLPKGFDGVNIMGYDDAVVLDSNLVNHTSPWPQYYLSATSFKLFGESPFAARLPFLLISLFSIPLIYYITLKLSGKKETAFIASLVSSLFIPYILFAYQARYYSLTVTFGLSFLLATLHLLEQKLWPKILFIISGTFFIYSHYISFPMFYAALFIASIVYLLLRRQKGKTIAKFIAYYLAFGFIIGLLFLPWFNAYQPLSDRGGIFAPNFSLIFFGVGTIFVEALKLFNYSNILPVLLLFMLFFLLGYKVFKKEDVSAYLFLLCLLFFNLFIAGILDSISYSNSSLIAQRYHVLLFPIAIILYSLLFSDLKKINKYFFLVIIFLFTFTNVLTLDKPRSFFVEYIGEILNPYDSPDKLVADYLKENANSQDTAIANLDRDYEPLIFYLGKKIKFVNRVSMLNPRLFPENRQLLPSYLYAYFAEPDWVIQYSKRGSDGTYFTIENKDFPKFYDLKNHYREIVLPVFFSDVSRPEIFWRSFSKIDPSYGDQVFIYQLKEEYKSGE